MRVGQVMSRQVVAVRPETTVEEANRLMQENHVSGLPVVDQAGELVGMISEGDLIRCLLPRYAEIYDDDRYAADFEFMEARADFVRRATVRDVMTAGAIAVTEDTPVLKAAAVMQMKGIKRIPVVRDGKLVGIISRADICSSLLGKTRLDSSG
jgi:CBS domain-containing protein